MSYSLPTEYIVHDKLFTVTNNGDYRMVLDCFAVLEDVELSEDYRVLASLLIFYNELQTIDDIYQYKPCVEELIHNMYSFFSCGQDDSNESKPNYRLLDWDNDSLIICAAINAVANTEIRAIPYLHWFTFMSYYMSVGESVLTTVVSIRSKIMKHKKLEKWEQTFKRENPKYFIWKSTTIEENEAEAEIKALWGK